MTSPLLKMNQLDSNSRVSFSKRSENESEIPMGT